MVHDPQTQRWLYPLLLGALFVAGFVTRGFIPTDTEPDSPPPPPSAPEAPATALTPPPAPAVEGYDKEKADSTYLLQTPGVVSRDTRERDYGLGPNYFTRLEALPEVQPGEITTFELWRYGGQGKTSFCSMELPRPFPEWIAHLEAQKPKLMEQVEAYMSRRFDLSGAARADGATMTRGKPIMQGPTARLAKGVESFEALAALDADAIRARDLFPYKPLAHPLQSIGHMLFPDEWVKAHPEHARVDVDFDIPTAYLPEFPPPLFLTTHKELGDVSRGREITIGNYYEIFNGLLTPEQMEGVKELLRPTPTTWFNQTHHRVTREPNAGVSCMSCHTNGHTNGAIALGPDARPNLKRLRTDTPTLRGMFNNLTLSSKRAIRGLDHFAEVEEYFDGDPGMAQAIGPRGVQASVNSRMGDFQSIIDYPPAPKLGPDMRLIRSKATPAEVRGEELFHGKANCASCHHGPGFTDNQMHDLQVERFYVGRPEGAIKTFGLRGIKDSPPYLHDGRLMTLDDTVEFFNLVFSLQLTAQEKDDLVAYLLCL